jgi:hypothetical protein
MENLEIQPFEQTLIQKGAVWRYGYLRKVFIPHQSGESEGFEQMCVSK